MQENSQVSIVNTNHLNQDTWQTAHAQRQVRQKYPFHLTVEKLYKSITAVKKHFCEAMHLSKTSQGNAAQILQTFIHNQHEKRSNYIKNISRKPEKQATTISLLFWYNQAEKQLNKDNKLL